MRILEHGMYPLLSEHPLFQGCNQELWPLEDRLLSSEARAYVRGRVEPEVAVAEVQVEALEETGEDAPIGVLAG
jgi:hypothetical protein